jgi:hypothetical protein
MAKTEVETPKQSKTIVKTEVISAPGARVTETEFTLSAEVQKRLQIRAKIPAAEK